MVLDVAERWDEQNGSWIGHATKCVPWPQSPWSILGFQNFRAISKIRVLWNIPLSFLYRQHWGLLQCFLSLYAFMNECCFRQVLRLCLVPASWSPGPRTPLPKMCLPVWAVPHVAGNLKASVYSAYSLPFHHKLLMKIFYLVFSSLLLFSFACDLAMPHFLICWDSKCHISVNSQPIDLKFNLGAYVCILSLCWQGDKSIWWITHLFATGSDLTPPHSLLTW